MTGDSPLSLLLIDDDSVDRQSVRRAFQRLGESPTIAEAVDSREAYRHLEAQPFDCILLDYRLPDADGLTIVRSLRGRGLNTPIIVLTGQGDEQIAVELMKAGATDYIVKHALTPEHLSHSVRNAIRLQRTELLAAQMRDENRARLQFLSELGRELASSLDMGVLITRIQRLLVPRMADWCAIDTLEPDDSLQRHTACAPAHAVWAEAAAACWVLDPQAADGVAVVLRSRAALIYPPGPDPADPQQPAALSGRLMACDVGAAICLPISSGERIFGGLTLMRRSPGGAYSMTEVALLHQITERIGAAFENARLYQLAQEAIQLRDDFLSIASHELRTPLTSLLGYVQLLERSLRRRHDLDEREGRAMATIVDQTNRLKRLINSMLDVSRLQDGQLSLEPGPLDLRSLVEQSVEELRPTLSEHELLLDGVNGPLPILGDEVRLQQVLLNLLQNAVKYSPHGGTISVQLDRQGSWATVTIRDEGIGIPQSSLDRIFKRFFRAPNANERRISGIGLGLYVVREIVALHGGQITVRSQVGHGSTFTVRLPLRQA